MKNNHRESGIFSFGSNLTIYRDAGCRITDLEDKINRRVNGDHTVGNGNFIRLETLRHQQRQAFTRILEGLGIIAVAAGAVATIIIASDGC